MQELESCYDGLGYKYSVQFGENAARNVALHCSHTETERPKDKHFVGAILSLDSEMVLWESYPSTTRVVCLLFDSLNVPKAFEFQVMPDTVLPDIHLQHDVAVIAGR